MENPTQPTTTPNLGEHAPVQSPHHGTHHDAAKRKKRLLFGIAGGVAVLLLVGGVFWFLTNKKDDKKTSRSTSTAQPAQPETVAPTPTDATPVTYKNAKLNIEITHRKDWTLKETSSGSEIILTSPSATYTKANATAGTNVFTLKIRKGASEAMKATVEKSIASRDSEVIAYAAPTESQRYYTNISYAGSQDAFNFFIVTGSVALKSGNAFAYTLSLDDETFVIVGGYGVDKASSLAFDPVPKGSIDTAVKEQALDIVKSLKIF